MIQRVELLAEDLNEGRPSDPNYCPIALALHRMYPGSDRVDVGTTVVEVLLSGKYYLTGDLPKEAQKFVEDFDYTGVKGKTKFPMPAPIAFDIDMKPRVY